MASASKRKSQTRVSVGKILKVEQLIGLTADLQKLRSNPPLVKRTKGRGEHKKGKREGDILDFVRGLRLSAGVIYFLRERLSSTDLEVNWGHLLDQGESSCSPECDVIIHTKGHVRKWNGNEKPIMDFRFVSAANVRAVVSCKSQLRATGIDRAYPKDLKKYGVKNIFLFAECCDETQFPGLRKKAREAGYCGLCCLYLTQAQNSSFRTDELMYDAFGTAALRAVKRPRRAHAR